LESLRHEREEARLKVERLEKELASAKGAVKSIEEERYELNKNVNLAKS
jgi:hypothetical protein